MDEYEYEELGFRIIQVFEKLESVDPVEFPILYDIIEVDALEKLIEHADPETYVQFEYSKRTIRVYGDERIEVMTTSD